MGLEHVRHRTGRPRGSKSTPRWVKDLRWAYANVGNPDPRPPTAFAGRLLALAKEQPDKLFSCLVALELRAPKGEGAGPGGGSVNGANGVPGDGRPRRVMELFVGLDDLVHFFRGGKPVRVAPLPRSCEIVGGEVDVGRDGVSILIRSEEFELVPPGQPPPTMQFQFASVLGR